MASKHEDVAAALVAQFATIVANQNGYVYTPDKIERIGTLFDESYFDSIDQGTTKTVYLVRPERETKTLGNGSLTTSKLEVSVLAATAYVGDPTKEFPAGETSQTRWQVAADVAHDVIECITRNPTLGGVAIGAGITEDAGVTVDYGGLPVWAMAEVKFTIRFRYPTGTR